MHIEISTNRHISASEGLTCQKGLVQMAITHLGDQITSAEVHLSDAKAIKGGKENIHYLMEVRLAGRQPTAVSHSAATLDRAQNIHYDLRRGRGDALGFRNQRADRQIARRQSRVVLELKSRREFWRQSGLGDLNAGQGTP